MSACRAPASAQETSRTTGQKTCVWNQRGTAQYWISVASSADGTKLVAAVAGGYIFTSADSGGTWMQRATQQGQLRWASVASSADGTRLVATVLGGYIYTSADGGASWTLTGTSQDWASVASSADGTKLAAAEPSGYIYTSIDSGVSWMQRYLVGLLVVRSIVIGWHEACRSRQSQRVHLHIIRFRGDMEAEKYPAEPDSCGLIIGWLEACRRRFRRKLQRHRLLLLIV